MTTDFSQDTYRPFSEQDVGAAIGFSVFAEAPRVLHVDADLDTALVLSMLLVPETQVTHVSSLAAAEIILLEQRFAMVVIDPDLPDGDGTSLVMQLQQRHPHVRVLTYSARHPERHTAGGAFLPKPWTSPRQLWRTVSELLGIGPAMPAEPQ